MGCHQSVEVVVPGGETDHNNVEIRTTGDNNNKSSTAKQPTHSRPVDSEDETESLIRKGGTSGSDQDHHSSDNFMDDYQILKQVTLGGKSSLSSIYMVLKRDREPEQQKRQEQQLDCDNNEAVVANKMDDPASALDDKVYVLQVIDMKSVAPERRRSMRKEIHALKKIHHPNSTSFGSLPVLRFYFFKHFNSLFSLK
jgi:hypothetical protein